MSGMSNLTFVDALVILALVFGVKADIHRRLSKLWDALADVEDRKQNKKGKP